MSRPAALPYQASLAEYRAQAEALFTALQAGDEGARWRFKWEHPRYRGRGVESVQAAELRPADAELVVAHAYGFDAWNDLARFTEAVQRDAAVARFEEAVEAVVSGDVATLRALLAAHPELARQRSARRHRATLLHYLGANGVEGGRQRTPANAVEVMQLLFAAGAEADALADLYDTPCTTMSMLVSSSHPAEAGLQAALAETLLDHGAALEGAGGRWQSPLLTALTFGFLDTARMLVRRGARVADLVVAAGLGRVEDVELLLPEADGHARHAALGLAAQHGHVAVVRALLDAGEDPDRNSPEGFHSHATPLHHAVWAGHAELVRFLIERGARLDLRDTLYHGTPLGWALYGGRRAIAEFLQARGAPM